ncbi:MAG: membrane protein insertion efficiency factor YidD [Bdellovibrionota bacterium]
MKNNLLFLVGVYRFSGTLFLGGNCRFTPSCSEYAVQALQQADLGDAISLITKRVCRCHPWGGSGHDPVPTMTRGARVCATK